MVGYSKCMSEVHPVKSQIAIPLDEQDLREIFALLSSSANEEKRAVYDPSNRHHFGNERLDEEYHVTQEKREFAVDAWRAVAYFL